MLTNISFKKWLLVLALLLLAGCIFDDDEDVEPWNAEAVCPAEGINVYGMPNRGTFTDERDGEVYRYTTIGNQVWMAENLRYDAPYSTCSNDTSFIRQYCELIEYNCETEACCKESLCRTFGRYYSIIEGGAEFGLIDSALADTICPKGWHIPTKEDWEILENAMKASGETGADAATRMKSANSDLFVISKKWSNESWRTDAGTEECAFDVIPSGFMYGDGETFVFGTDFLSKTQNSDDFVVTFRVTNGTGFTYQRFRNSVRCVMD